MKSKVARKLALAIICCITAAVVAVMLVMSFKAFGFSDALMNSRNEATMNVLRSNLQSQLDRLENTYTILEIGSGDIGDLWDAARQTDSDFAAVFDKDGSLIWQSDNYDLSDFMSARTNYSGVVDDSTAGLTIQVSKDLGDKVAVCGMKLSETGWLDDIKKEALAEVTVFSGKNRYATTLLQDGSRMKGSMNDNVANEVFSDKGIYTGTTSIDGQKYYVLYDVITDIGGKQVGAFFSGISAAESDAQRASLITGACIIGFAAIAASVMILITMTMKIVIIPIQEAGRIADSMSKGKLKGASVDMPLYDDEIGAFVRKLENTCGTLDSYISDISSVLSRIAGGDFTVSASVGYVGEFADISDSFDNINKSLTGLIGEIRRAANDVTSGASQIADGASDLASGATEQASSVEKLSVSISSIADKVTASAGAAVEISEMSDKSLNRIIAQKGAMTDMLNSMAEIKERSDAIEGIIKVIDDIAFQTNILALNASIEAARAGDAGKGFAVVAGEVGSLAEKSAESAKRTAELIKLTIEAVGKGSEIAESTAESMNSVASMSEDIRNKVMGIAAASGEEASALENIKSSVNEISNVVTRTTATAEQTASACAALNGQANSLSRHLTRFKY